MTNSSGGSKGLKDQNRFHLWLIIAANCLIFYGASQSEQIALSGLSALLNGAAHLLPVGLTVVVTTVVNNLLSDKMKARLVFLRWAHALPGHRAFSKYGKNDPRVDMMRLQRALGNKMPTDPEEENRAWYKFYLELQNVSAVQHVHRDFLLLRDYAGIAALFLLAFGTTACFTVRPAQVLAFYLVFLFGQFALVRHAAATNGIRFVCTVLAQKSAKPPKIAAAG